MADYRYLAIRYDSNHRQVNRLEGETMNSLTLDLLEGVQDGDTFEVYEIVTDLCGEIVSSILLTRFGVSYNENDESVG